MLVPLSAASFPTRSLRRQVHQGQPLRRPGRIRPANSRPSYNSIKGAFYSPGYFMENFQSQTFLAPWRAPDCTWVMAATPLPRPSFPLSTLRGNTSKLVGAILAEPDKYEGKRFCAAPALYSWEEVTAIMSKERPRRWSDERQTGVTFLGLVLDILSQGGSMLLRRRLLLALRGLATQWSSQSHYTSILA